ncbi:hypothetical protein BU25DRAFT_495555 [Macroventuria anomochaeta]|uniref:Uncharacterized protein n=1 Tax=Macroventuria anomochaeta TaxID=301207 RepID=A0ACB6RKH0_9PLEO|nr:uncharacterized protein BU25DRAFT_495555 [Macroventuria anomochaeta]KAF2621659.1 hypothetical protein BU25DRAFT_495555 [Macroventuria anomochaeta]
MDPETALDMLLPPRTLSEGVETSEAFNHLAFIFPTPSNAVHIHNRTLSLSVFWLRVSPTTLTLFASAIHEIHSDTHFPHRRDVSALALQRVLEREKEEEGCGKVVYQPGSWYGVPENGEVERGKGKAMFGQPRPGNVFKMERELGMLLEQAEGKGGDADMGAIERDVSVWWERVMEARRGGAGGG